MVNKEVINMFKVGDKVIITNNLRYGVVYHTFNRSEILVFTYAEAVYLRNKEATVIDVLDEYGVRLDVDKGGHVWPTYLLNNADLRYLLQNDIFGELSNGELFKVHNPFLVLESGETLTIKHFDKNLYSVKDSLYINTLSEKCKDFIDYYDSKYIYVHNLGFGDEYVYKTVDELKKYYEKSTDQKVIIVYDLKNEDNL